MIHQRSRKSWRWKFGVFLCSPLFPSIWGPKSGLQGSWCAGVPSAWQVSRPPGSLGSVMCPLPGPPKSGEMLPWQPGSLAGFVSILHPPVKGARKVSVEDPDDGPMNQRPWPGSTDDARPSMGRAPPSSTVSIPVPLAEVLNGPVLLSLRPTQDPSGRCQSHVHPPNPHLQCTGRGSLCDPTSACHEG